MDKTNYHKTRIENFELINMDFDETINNIKISTKVLEDAKRSVLTIGFKDEQEEIIFFKRTKPLMLADILYHRKVLKIATKAPPLNSLDLEDYYIKCQKNIFLNFKKNIQPKNFYYYWRTGAVDRDKEYFLRKNFRVSNSQHPLALELDKSFSTYYDNLIATFIYYEMIDGYISNKIEKLKNRKADSEDIGIKMKWGGNQTELVELIYALYNAKVINTRSIQDAVRFFENYFDFEINDAYHVFHRMQFRSGSRTIFIDKLKSVLESVIDKKEQ